MPGSISQSRRPSHWQSEISLCNLADNQAHRHDDLIVTKVG
jgi:hypothetical protein